MNKFLKKMMFWKGPTPEEVLLVAADLLETTTGKEGGVDYMCTAIWRASTKVKGCHLAMVFDIIDVLEVAYKPEAALGKEAWARSHPSEYPDLSMNEIWQLDRKARILALRSLAHGDTATIAACREKFATSHKFFV